MWVFIRTYDYPICNKSWVLSSIGGQATFTAYYYGEKYEVVYPIHINDATWHLINWGKYLVNDEMRLFISVDNSVIIESESFHKNITFQNSNNFKLAREDSIYSTIYADELCFIEGIKYTQAIGSDLYGQGIFYPCKPTALWPSGQVKCYWQFNNPNIVDDKSGNGNTGTNWNGPKIAHHVP